MPQQSEPVGDASMSQQPMPDMQQNQPSMDNGMVDPQMEDPNMGMGDEQMGTDMQGQDQMNIPNNDGGNIERDKKNIQKNIGKACADFRSYQGQDKEDLGKWISGMLDSLDGDSDDENVDFEDGEQTEQQMPMEGVYTKKELDSLNEVFGCNDEDSEKNNVKKQTIKKQTKSPFNNPKFN